MQNDPHVISLIRQIQKGDQSALNHLCKSWYPRVYRYALRFTGCEEMSKEACQMTFVSVSKHIYGLKQPESYVPWLFRITANHCRNLFNGRSQFEDPEILKVALVDMKTPHANLVKQEQIKAVRMALMKIPKDQREVIILKEYEGLKFREIADVLEVSENTIKARMYYGLNALKKTLNATKEIYHEAS